MKALALFTGSALRSNMQCAAVGIEVTHPKSSEMTIPSTGLKSRANQQAESGSAALSRRLHSASVR